MQVHSLFINPISRNNVDAPLTLGKASSDEAINESLVLELVKNFNSKPNRSYGALKPSGVFNQELETFLLEKKAEPFNRYLIDKMKADSLPQAVPAEGAFLCIHYEIFSTQFLLLIWLDNSQAYAIDQSMALTNLATLNLKQFALAVRIDISQWQQTRESQMPDERYVAWFIGSDKRNSREWLINLFELDEQTNSRKETGEFLQALDGYCNEQSALSDDEKREIKEKAVAYCHDQAEAGTSVVVKDLSKHISEGAGEDFMHYINRESFQLHDEIPPDRTLLRQYAKYSGRATGLSITFDEHLLGKTIVYDESSDTLTIKRLPDSLKKQLHKQTQPVTTATEKEPV